MELFVLLFGVAVVVAVVVAVLILFVNWLFSPTRLKPKTNEPYSLNTKDSDLSYYNQANNIFNKLQNIKDQKNELIEALLEIVRLCQLEIQQDRSGRNQGDPLVLLANAYFILAAKNVASCMFNYCLVRSFALITHWRTVPMYTKNRGNAEKLQIALNTFMETAPEVMWEETPGTILSISRGTNKDIYTSALTPEALKTIWKFIELDIYLRMAKEKREEGNYEDAAKIYTVIIEKDPSNKYAYYERGQIYQHAGLSEKAIDDFTTALSLKTAPTSLNVFLYSARGKVYSETNRNAEATKDFNQADALRQ